MDLNEVYKMVQLIEENDLGNLESSNNIIAERINLICNFLVSLSSDWSEELEIFSSLNVRFCDYYDSSMFHGRDIITYFNDNYKGNDKEKLTVAFAIYVFLNNVVDLIYNYDFCEDANELYYLLDCNNYFEDLLEIIYYLKEKKLSADKENIPKFLNADNKYKIMFSGLAFDDIKRLDKTAKKALIRKLGGQLSTSDCITLSESIGHVKELHDFPISRIYLGSDYRIAYIRKDNVTVVLGISFKSGKDKDYNRYDSVAKRKKEIYSEIELFNSGLLSNDSVHFSALQVLLDFYQDEMLDHELHEPGHLK